MEIIGLLRLILTEHLKGSCFILILVILTPCYEIMSRNLRDISTIKSILLSIEEINISETLSMLIMTLGFEYHGFATIFHFSRVIEFFSIMSSNTSRASF